MHATSALKIKVSQGSSSFRSPTAPLALASLQMLRLRFTHELEDDAELDVFKGAVWHGVFGMALMSVDKQAYCCLFESAQRAAPWRLSPPVNAEKNLIAGTKLHASVVLFNDAIQHAPACAAAIAQMGIYGFGSNRARARLEDLTGHIGDQPVTLQSLFSRHDSAECGLFADAFFSGAPVIGPKSICLQLVSPLTLKVEGHVSREAPGMATLVTRLLGRLVGLLPVIEHGFFNTDQRADLLRAAASVRPAAMDVRWFEWQRYSGRQKSVMPFGGLIGDISYSIESDEAELIWPWLRMAEWLGVGSKTTFGHGQIILITLPNKK